MMNLQEVKARKNELAAIIKATANPTEEMINEMTDLIFAELELTSKDAPVQKPTTTKVKTMTGEYEGRDFVYGAGGQLLEVDGKKIATGKKKRGGGGSRSDAGRDAVTEFVLDTLATQDVAKKLGCEVMFKSTKEGLVMRAEEADYAVKVSKSKEAKFDPTEEGFEAEVSLVTRGKAKHQGASIARILQAALLKSKIENEICEVKASGIVIQYAGGEYTLKISKKRDRVAMENEKGDAYQNLLG